MENVPKEVFSFFYDLRAYGLYSSNTPALRCLVPDLQSGMPIGLSAKGPRIFSVANIDSALNPRLVKALLGLIQSWMKHIILEKQMFCTVHNLVALDSFDFTDENMRLFVVVRDSDGVIDVQRIRINEQLMNISKEKHMPLSQLWIDGYIGGVPNV